MKTLKLNFTVPEDIAESLKARVSKRSAFVAAAVLEKLKELEEEQLKQALRKGYQTREEDAEMNRDCEKPTLEGWLLCNIQQGSASAVVN